MIESFCYRITFLEDLHAGSGQGTPICDRLLARDHKGAFIIPESHVKGVWLNNARRLQQLGQIEGAEIETLFGTQGDKQGILFCPSLRSAETPIPLTWDAAARKPNDRAPDDHSLRRTEYLPAGTEMAGTAYLFGADEPLKVALKKIVRFTDRLGAERSRGGGQIQAEFESIEEKEREELKLKPQGNRLRLVLENLAPLNIPRTGFPGNIIDSESHIPGRALFGALCAWRLEQGQRPDLLFDRKIAIGPAYPLPGEFKDASPAELQVIPFPLHLHFEKASEKDQPMEDWPHWANFPVNSEDKKPLKVINKLVNDHDKAKTKRPKGHLYLARQGGQKWRYHVQPLEQLMRNRRGPEFDMNGQRARVKAEEADLFTTEQIPAHTRFLAEIHAPSDKLQEFIKAFRPLLEGSEPLRIGRGGVPARIVAYAEPRATKDKNPPPKPEKHLSLLLTSDLIARASDNLGFHQTLDRQTLKDLGIDLPQGRQPKEFSDSGYVRSFNGVTRLPQPGFDYIRRGSVLRIEGTADEIRQIRKQLQEKQTLGERPWEGHGRFLLDPPEFSGDILKAPAPSPSIDQAIARREKILAGAETFATEHLKGGKLTPTQRSTLMGTLAALPGKGVAGDELKRALEAFYEGVKDRLGGGQNWEPILGNAALFNALECCQEGKDYRLEEIRLFLRRAWMSAEEKN